MRYVDDILITYDSSHTDINSIQNDFNTINPSIKFTTETESNNQIYFLGVTIHRTPTNWKISIYRNPSFTDTIIPFSSNHPAHHKYAAVRFLHNRLNTYHLQKDEYNEEININKTSWLTTGSQSTQTNHPPLDTPRTSPTYRLAPTHKNGQPLHTSGKSPLISRTYLKRLT